MEPLGRGTLVSGGSVRGVGRRVTSVDDVVRLLGDADLAETILVTASASATTMMPLLPDVAGVVCTEGGPTSHLAIVARDFGITCVVGASLLRLDDADGKSIEILGDGVVMVDD